MCARGELEESAAAAAAAEALRLQLRQKKKRAVRQHQQLANSDPAIAEAASAGCGINQDILALSTVYYKLFLCGLSDLGTRFQESRAYKVLFCTTQPAHVVTLVAVTTIATLVVPADRRGPLDAADEQQAKPSALGYLIYLAAFMMHFGAQMWMTFVSGLSLYFAVPRHTFGEVQKVLFPKYFGLNSFLSLVTLFMFVKLHPQSSWDTCTAVQVGCMVLCFLVELVIRLYLAPPLLRLITAKNAIEKAAGVGLEVGKHDPGPLAHCPHYLQLHRTFRKIHMAVAMGNMLAMACTAVHLHYLSNKICNALI